VLGDTGSTTTGQCFGPAYWLGSNLGIACRFYPTGAPSGTIRSRDRRIEQMRCTSAPWLIGLKRLCSVVHRQPICPGRPDSFNARERLARGPSRPQAESGRLSSVSVPFSVCQPSPFRSEGSRPSDYPASTFFRPCGFVATPLRKRLTSSRLRPWIELDHASPASFSVAFRYRCPTGFGLVDRSV